MANVALLAFNRGRISRLALARTDFSRTALSADIQTNWMPRALGSMMLRPGLEYTGATKSNAQSVTIPFIFADDDTARLEITNGVMRVWVDDELVTRAAVTSAITNGGFNTDLTGWSDEDGGASVSAWLTGGYMSLIGDGNAAAKRRQEVVCGNIGVRHALNIVIDRGPVILRVGSTAGGDDYISETTLGTGYHSLAFTPTGNFWIDLFNYNEAASLVDSIAVASSGTMEVTAPWLTADLSKMRWDQSGDVVFVACSGYQQRRIERRASDSWSIVLYQSNDGPFRVQNVGPVTIAPSGTSGDVTLTASSALFRSTQIGTLFKLTHTGQLQEAALSGSDQYSDPIRVTGVDGTRAFALIINGTWTGTLTLQYSVSEPGDWVDAALGTYSANTAISYDDTLDNQVIYYRIGFKAGAHGSGTANVSLSSSSGTQTGIARVTGYTSATSVSAAVLEDFGATSATADWSESYWSAFRGYPSAGAFNGGRLWWAGKNRIWGSISDAFDSFDDEFEGDAGPISRSIGSGPVDRIHWLVSGSRLVLGAAGAIFTVRSSSLDEPITPTNFNLKDMDTPGSGSADIAAVKSGTSAVYAQQGGMRVFEAAIDANGFDYTASDLSVHVPEICEPGIVKIVEQHKPERRRHCIRSDGTVAVLVYDRAEDIKCWIDVETPGASGFVEDAVVLPGETEDQVYYTVKRTIGGSTVRYHEKFALESECVGGTLNKQADSFVSVSGSGASITGLSHLNGQEVVCWADGVDCGTFTVSGGAIAQSYSSGAVVGLAYEADYKSTKLLNSQAELLTRKKRVSGLGLVGANIHAQGLEYGPDFDSLDPMPLIEDGAEVDQDSVRSVYDEPAFTFAGRWDSDSRVCLRASAPRPCTILALVLEIE